MDLKFDDKVKISSENLTVEIDGKRITRDGVTSTFGSYTAKEHRGHLSLALFNEDGEYLYSLFFYNYGVN